LWVNGEKYVFSKDVLDHGKNLFRHFSILRTYLARLTRKLQQTNEDDDNPTSTLQIKNLSRKKDKLTTMLKQLDE